MVFVGCKPMIYYWHWIQFLASWHPFVAGALYVAQYAPREEQITRLF